MLRVQVTAILDKRKSETNIQQDLSNISSSLQQSKTNQIKLIAELNKEKTLSAINSNLQNDILTQINKQPLKIVADLDVAKTTTNFNNALKKIVGSVTLNVNNSNIKPVQPNIVQNTTTANTTTPANKQNNVVSKDVISYKNALVEAKKQFVGLGEVSANWTKTAQGEIEGFTVSVKKANGEVEKFKYALRETKTGEQFFAFTGSLGNDSGILKLQKNIDATKAKAKEMLSALNNTSRGTVGNTQMYKDLLQLTDVMKDTSDIDRFNNKFKELKALVNDIYSRSRTGSSLNPIQNLQDKLSNADVQLRNIQSSFSQLQARSANNTSSTFQSELTSVQSKIGNIVAEYNKLKNIDLLKISDSNKLLQTVDQMRTFINSMQSVNSQMNALKREASATQAQLNATAQSQNLVFDKKKLSNQILAWMNNNTKAAKAYGEQLNQLLNKIETVTNAKGLSTIHKEFASMRAEASARGLLGNTFFTTLVNDIKKFSTWFGVGGAVARAVRSVKQMFTNVKELDSAMVELKKVTDETNDTYQEFLAKSTIKAKELGVTITDLVKATSSFAKLGYSLEDSSKLGEVATMYANVGDEIESVDDAASSIISTIKAFDIDASDSMSIIDKINEVSNKENISAGGLGEALQKSAAALATANNDINQTLALITAGNLVNQDPSAVGTGLKTVSLRIRGAKAELEKLGEETEDVVESTSKLQAEIKALTGVDILESDGNAFKSTYQILKEISEVWNDLSDLNQATVLEDLFGKRQANIGASILSNFDVAEKTLKESLNSEGSAEKEYKKWLESIEAKQAQFKASFEALSNSLISSDFVKGAVESGSKILDLITKINDGLGLMPILLSTISSVWLTKNNAGLFTKDNSGALHFFTQTKRNNIDIEANKITNAINRCSTSWDSLGASGQALTSQTEMMNNEFKDLDPTLTRGVAATGNFAGAQQQLQKNVTESKNSIKLFSGALTKLKGLASAIGTSLVNFGISMLISVVFSSIVKAVNSSSEAMEKAADKAEQLSEQSKTLADTQQQIVELKNRLSDVNITENEAVSIRKQLYEIQNDLIEQYGTEKLKIDLVRDSVDNLSSAFDGLNASQLKTTYDENPKQYSDALNRIYGKVNDPTSNIGYKYFGFTNKPSGSIASDLVNDVIGNRTFIETENEQDTQILNDVYKIVGEYLEENFEDYVSYLYDSDKNSNYISFNADAYFKEHDYSRREIVKTYEDIISYLSDERLKIGETGKQYLDEFINEFLSVKNKIADDKYKNDDNLVTTYAQYLLSHDDSYNELNIAYQAMLAAQTDYNTALTSGNQDSINSAMSNLNFAREELVKILNNKNKVDDATQDGQAIIDFVNNAINIAQDLTAKETLKIKLEADDSTFKKEVSDNIKALGNGEVVSKEDLLNYTIKDPDNLTKTDEAFQSIQKSAESNNLSLEEYCDVLIEIGLLHGQVSKDGEDLDFTPILDMNTESMKELNEEIDKVQSSFDTIKDVITDYNTTGVLSIDNLQKLLTLDSEYIKLMFDENGSLVLNEQAYQDLAKAKLENIKLDMLRNAIDDIKKIEDEGDALEYLELQYNKTTEASGDYTEAVLNSLVAEGISQGGNVKKAVELIYDEYLQYVTLIDNTDTTFRKNTETTNEQVEALENQKEALSDVKEGLEQQKEALEKLNSEYEDSQDKINNLVDLTVDMLKQKYEDEKEIIEKQKTAYKDRVDSLKESLEEEQDAYDRHQSLSEKKNDISTLQRQAYSLQGTTSVEGKQRLAEIQEELSEATQDLHDTQYENSIKDRQDALDQEYERKEKLWDKEIERIEEVVGNERQLRVQAMKLIDTKSNEFYNDLWSYVFEYTTKSKFEFNTLWNEAYSALDKYNWGQLTCMQIMDLLEQNIYNVGLQIDTVADNIGNVSLEIDKVSTSVENLKKALEGLPQGTIQTTPLETPPQTVQQPPTLSELKTSIDEFHKNNKSTQSTQSVKNSFAMDPSEFGASAQQPSPPKTTLTQSKSYDWYFYWDGITYVAPKGYTKAQAVEYIHDSIPKFVSTTVIKTGIKHYAKGTLSSKGGLSIVDEEGSELILSQPQKGRYANLNEGSVVFTKDQTENLWELSKLSDPPKKFMDAYNKFKSVYVKNGNHFFMNKSNENYLSDIRGNSSINTNSVHNNDNKTINVPINVTVNNASGLNEKKLATEIKNDIFREFRRYGSWLG